MYEIKPNNNINPQDLCILTEPQQNGEVDMYQKDQPICSESRLEALKTTIDRLDSIYYDLIRVGKINNKLNAIIYDETDSPFPGLDVFDFMDNLKDMVSSKIKRIKELPEVYQLTKTELSNCYNEMQEPENQTPFGAGFPSLSDIMEDV